MPKNSNIQIADQLYYVYVLRSLKDGRFYVGSTNDLKDRLIEHGKGKVFSTRFRLPFEMAYYEVCLNEADARKREKYLKTAWGKRYLKNRMSNYLAQLCLFFLFLFVPLGFVSAGELFDHFTIALWTQPEGSVASQAILVKNEELRLVTDGSGNPACQIHDGNAWQTAAVSSDSITSSEWVHLACRYDRSELRVYVDGIEKGSQALSVTLQDTANTFKAGEDDGGTYNDYAGIIDDVKFYNYARSQKQILEDMQGGSPSAGSGRSLNSTVFFLDFDEGYGETAHDESGFDNHGTLYPGISGDNTATSAMWTIDGKFGKALDFDGNDDYVVFSNQFTFSEYTVASWFKVDDQTADRTILENGDGASDRWWLGVDDSRGLGIEIDNGTSDNYYGTAVENGKWYFVAVSQNNSGDFSLYLDGELQGSGQNNSLTWDDFSSPAMYIGTGDGMNDYFDGHIDEVKIWNYVLSLDEVGTVYNQGKSAVLGSGGADSSGSATDAASGEYCVPGDTSQCDPPVGEWRFDEKAGQTAYDTSGNGNDGTLGASSASGSDDPQWGRGKFGSGLDFDGSDDYVGINSQVVSATQGTIEAWVKPRAYPDNTFGHIVKVGGGDGGGGHDELHLSLHQTSGEVTAYFGSVTDNGVEGRIDAGSISLDEWTHLAFNYVNNGDMDLYINGSLAGSDTISGTVQSDDWPSELLVGKCDSVSNPRYFEGIVDQVRIYDYARTPAQIAWEYNKGKPIAHWRMDEGEGSVVHDDSGNDNHGTLYLGSSGNTSTSSAWTAGKLNDGMDFDGGDDYVDISDNSVFDFGINTDFTIGAWIKSEGGVNDQLTILSKGDNSGVSGRIIFKVYDDTDDAIFITAGSGNDCDGSIDVLDGNWHYVLLEADRDGNLIGYVDGEIDCTSGASNDQNLDTDINVQIGRSWDGTSDRRYFDGMIDEVKVWNYALTAEQVKSEYNGGRIRFE